MILDLIFASVDFYSSEKNYKLIHTTITSQLLDLITAARDKIHLSTGYKVNWPVKFEQIEKRRVGIALFVESLDRISQ